MTDELIFYINNTFWFWIKKNKIDNNVYCKSHTTQYHWWYEQMCPQVGSKSRTEERCCSPHQLWAHCRHTVGTLEAAQHLHISTSTAAPTTSWWKQAPHWPLARPSLCWRCFEMNMDSISLKHTNKPSYHTNQLAAMLDNHELMWVRISTVD